MLQLCHRGWLKTVHTLPARDVVLTGIFVITVLQHVGTASRQSWGSSSKAWLLSWLAQITCQLVCLEDLCT